MLQSKNKESLAVIAILLAGILWGVICVFIKGLSAAGLGSPEIAFVRMLVAVLLFTVPTFIKDPKTMKIQLKDIWMFIGMGIVSITLFNYCYFRTVIESGTSVAVVLLYTSPIFIMLIAAVLFREKITGIKIAALVATFIGCILVAGIIGGGARLSGKGLMVGVLAGFFYALYTIFGRYALAKYDSMTVTAWTFIFGLIGTAVLADLPLAFTVLITNGTAVLLTVGIGIVSTIVPYLLYTWGLNYVESGKAGIIVAVEPVVGSLIGMLAYGEPHNIEKIMGLMLVISAIVLLNIPDRSPK